MKHVIDTQWVNIPTRERLAATRKRTLRSVLARGARSVWSKCQSRVIEFRNSVYRLGLPVPCRGDNTDVHTVSRLLRGTQATCMKAGPESESGAKAHGGILESWENRPEPSRNRRIWTTPAEQRPGAGAELSAARASETWGAVKDSASEGNRSERGNGSGSLSGRIVAMESRRTSTEGSL